jgi:L-alanine-DL-glutamate epimerase-like enolase superfamily enzyme
MKITSIRVGLVHIPLKTPFITALRRVDEASDLIVMMETDDGATGYGNAPATVVITGDSYASIEEAICHVIGPKLIGRSIEDREGLLQTIQESMVHNTSAKAALDIAIHDLFCQHYSMPLYRFFGGCRTEIASDLTISLNAPDIMAEDAKKALEQGYTTLKLKVGVDATLDWSRVKAIRHAVGPDIQLRLDANQGWKPKEAVRIITAMEDADFNIELIEQPVKAYDIDGLSFVTSHVATPIMADESAFSPRDVFTLLSRHACDLINIKLMKAGGLGPASQIAAMAQACGVDCMMGCMLESKVGISAAAALSAGSMGIVKNDLDAADLMADDPFTGGITYHRNTICLPDTPGLGITGVKNWKEVSVI